MKYFKRIFCFIFILFCFLSDRIVAFEKPKISPNERRGIYVTTNVALLFSRMEKIIELIKNTELDMIIIDVKVDQSVLTSEDKDKIKEVIDNLHRIDVWVVARIVVFRDHVLSESKSHLALKTKNGRKWRDSQGVYWVDPAAEEVWDYNIEIAKQAIDFGFDEINFDYIRFPSDGRLSDIRYPVYKEKMPKYEVMNKFYKKLYNDLKEYKKDIIISADIFGYSLIVSNDLHVGQKLSSLVDYFDIICPMIYPSHYSNGNFGYKSPAANPYEVILKTIQRGKITLGDKYVKIRPWLQDFSIRGVRYDAEMIKKEKKAVYDSGLRGWCLWNAGNFYTENALNQDR